MHAIQSCSGHGDAPYCGLVLVRMLVRAVNNLHLMFKYIRVVLYY